MPGPFSTSRRVEKQSNVQVTSVSLPFSGSLPAPQSSALFNLLIYMLIICVFVYLVQVETEQHGNQSQIRIALQPFRRQPQNQPSEQRPRRWNVSVPRLQLLRDHRQPRGQSNLCM